MKCIPLFVLICLSFSIDNYAQYKYHAIDVNKDSTNGTLPGNFIEFNNKIYFSGRDSLSYELWCYDRDTDTSGMIPPISSDRKYGVIHTQMIVCNNELYYCAGDSTFGFELYKYDGINKPVLAADINSGPGSSAPICIAQYGKMIYLSTSINGNYDIYEYNTVSGKAKSITSSGIVTNAWPSAIIYKNLLYFSGGNTSTGYELCSYDPLTGTTAIVADILPGTATSSPRHFAAINNILYFQASANVSPSTFIGTNLYAYDGINKPINISNKINPNGGPALYTTHWNSFAGCNGHVYFCANDGTTGYKIYKYTYGTNSLKVEFPFNRHTDKYVNYKNKLYFTTGDMTYMYDFINPPTPVCSLVSNMVSREIFSPTIISDTLFFAGHINKNSGGVLSNGEFCFLYDSSDVVYEDTSIHYAEPEHAISVTAYPNPFTEVINFDITQKDTLTYSIELVSNAGYIAYEVLPVQYPRGKHIITIPVDLYDGIYMYKIKKADGTVLSMGKLLKQ